MVLAPAYWGALKEKSMRNRFSILLGLIALIAAAAPAHANPGDVFCNKGSFLVGFKGHVGAWIDRLQPVCAPWDASAQKLGPTYDGAVYGNLTGGSVNETRAICGPSQAVVHMEFGWATPNGPPGHVQNLDLTCVSIFNLQVIDSWHPQMLSDNGARSGGNDCVSGNIATGVWIGLDGVNLANLRLMCDLPSVIMHEAPSAQDVSPSFHPSAAEVRASLERKRQQDAADQAALNKALVKHAVDAKTGGGMSGTPGATGTLVGFSGHWSVHASDGTTFPMTLSLSGTLIAGNFDPTGRHGVVSNGVVSGANMTAAISQKDPTGMLTLAGTGKFHLDSANNFSGTWTMGTASGTWTGLRLP